MIDKSALTAVLERGMEGTDLFLVDVRISKDNNIVVEIDSDTSVDIDECIRLNRLVESEFDRDEEDYELEIDSILFIGDQLQFVKLHFVEIMKKYSL